MEQDAKDDRVFATIHDQQRLLCVELPAVVENDERAIACLGGLSSISKASFETGGGLELRFRPDDRYCKPAIAREEKVTNLVLRVRRRRRQRGCEGCKDGREDSEYSVELLGIANKLLHFPGMADYQVLPPGLNETTLSDQHTPPPAVLQLSEPLDEDFVDRPIPTFFPPASFSKFDKPFNYLSPKTATMVGGEVSSTGEATPNKQRPKRVHNIYGFMCDYKGPIPTGPHPQAYGLSYAEHPKIQEIKQLLEERPLWTRPAIQYRVKVNESFLRCLLSNLCYKFLSQPYKNLWVRFGYDPRSDPSSKIYQSIDYRVPYELLALVPEGRKTGPRGLADTMRGQKTNGEEEMTKEPKQIEETAFIFFPDRLPSQRQLSYQLCDIRDPEVQQLIHSNDGQEEPTFKEGSGWCAPDTYDKIRKILSARLRALFGTTNRESPSVKRKKTNTTGKQ